jgi:hypothetical protein
MTTRHLIALALVGFLHPIIAVIYRAIRNRCRALNTAGNTGSAPYPRQKTPNAFPGSGLVFHGTHAAASGFSTASIRFAPHTLRDPGFPLRNAALLFASASGIGLATVFTGIFALPSVEPIPSPTADQRILSATSTNQVVTT